MFVSPILIKQRLLAAMDEAEDKAWSALAGYKFWMFGYWSAQWVRLNEISGASRPNPFKEIVKIAKRERRDRQLPIGYPTIDGTKD